MANPKQNEAAPAGASSKPPEPPESEPPTAPVPRTIAATFTRAPETDEREPAPEPPPRDAVVITTAEGTLCRAPVGVGIHTLGPVVIGNWVGHIDGKSVTVDHGTPLRGLPPAVLKKIRETPDQKVGPFDARKKRGQPQTGV